jgi:hypothetical protein
MLTDIHVLSTRDFEKVVSGMPYVFMCVCVCACARARAWRIGWILFIFSIQELSIRGPWPVNINILPKIGALHRGAPNIKLLSFSKTAPTVVINFSILCGPPPYINLHGRYLQESNGTSSSGPNVKFPFSWQRLDSFWLYFNRLWSKWA